MNILLYKNCLGLNRIDKRFFAFGTPPFVGHTGGQNEISSMGVVGTLGTADTNGTAQILPFSVDPATGARADN